MITPTKIQSIHNTPNKINNLQNLHNTNCKDESTNSLLNHENILPIDQREVEDLLNSSLFKSPIFKRQEKVLQSANTTPCSERKRTISTISDYDVFKSELNNAENFIDFEKIDLLHDLNDVIKFEDTKVSSDILLSSMIDISAMRETDDSLLSMNKDPATDPLSISDRERKDTDTTFVDSESESPVPRRKSYKRQAKEKAKINIQDNNSFNEQKHKLTTKENHLLKELENIEEWEDLPLIIIKKLQSLHIKLIHKVPPQHKIELTGSHAPTKEKKKLFQKYGPLRKGLYSPVEDKIIKKNWETFCELHDWDSKRVEPFLNWRHKGRYYIHNVAERQKFVQFIANGLPWRTLHSVYSRFKVLHRDKITYARYTSKEDKKILTYMQNKHLDKRDTKYIELAKLLKRTRGSVFKRYQYLKRIENKSKTGSLTNVRWTLPLIKKFIKTLLDVTISDDVSELKYAILPKPVWQKMEEKLNISENVLKTFWQHQLHIQLFSTSPIYLNDIKIKLIEYMYGKGISNTREIIWHNVARYFDGATAVFLCKVFFYLVQECNMSDADNFADVVEYLYHTKISEIQKAPTDKFLPRIVYENGKIYLLNTESDNTIKTDTHDHEDDTDDSNADDI